MLFRDFLTLLLMDNQEILLRLYCSDCPGEYWTKRELLKSDRYLDCKVEYIQIMLGGLLLVTLEQN